MGSLVSPMVANLYMEGFERKALSSCCRLYSALLNLLIVWVVLAPV